MWNIKKHRFSNVEIYNVSGEKKTTLMPNQGYGYADLFIEATGTAF